MAHKKDKEVQEMVEILMLKTRR